MDKELKDFLDIKFNKIDKDLEEIKADVGINKINILANQTNILANQTNILTSQTNILVGFKEAKEERAIIERRINDTYNMVDGFAKNVDELQDEFVVIKEDSKRVKAVLREKLSVDVI